VKARTPGGILVARAAAWLGAAGLALASWTPSEDLIRPGLGGLPEHLLAYFLTGVSVMIGYPKRSRWAVVIVLSIYAALLEIGQTAVPGRHPGLLDWAGGVTGALGAWLVVFGLHHLWPAMKRSG
jgi:VanZ family protein